VKCAPKRYVKPVSAATPLTHNWGVTRDVVSSCKCAEERLITRRQEFDVAPAPGGGWLVWSHALARLLARLSVQPAHCVVITQEPNQRYVQLIIGHGHAHVQASSNTYLEGDFRLGPTEEAQLRLLGFNSPDELDDDHLGPHNWWFDQASVDPFDLAELLGRMLMSITAFDSRWPIHIEVFGADSPCDACFWEDG
jgi:hypothetical protein